MDDIESTWLELQHLWTADSIGCSHFSRCRTTSRADKQCIRKATMTVQILRIRCEAMLVLELNVQAKTLKGL